VLDGYRQRVDDGYTPVITQILNPAFVQLSGYPQNMIRYDVGLWYFQFKLPRLDRHDRGHDHYRHFEHQRPDLKCVGRDFRDDRDFVFRTPNTQGTSESFGNCDGYVIGTYLVDIAYQNPDTGLIVNDKRQIIVSAPFGMFNVLSGKRFGCFPGRAW
jgi:hypothetical protein